MANQTSQLLSTFNTTSENDPDAFKLTTTLLSAHLSDPLHIDFASPDLFREAIETAKKHSPNLTQALSKASLYASIVSDSDSDVDSDSSDVDPTASRVLTSLTDAFSSTLFQPPPALHMDCSDTIADHWMSDVVTPALAMNGLTDPFQTISRISDLPWRDFGVCEECVQERRRQWKEEAMALWKEIDAWMNESK